MTNGGTAVTKGGSGRALLLAWLAFAAIGGLYAAVNAASVIADLARLGRTVPNWEPWTWELTSFATWLVIAPFAFAAAERLGPPRFTWPAALAIHALLSIPASLAHVGIMVGLRKAIYAAAGSAYEQGGTVGSILVYEYRKDFVTYAVFVLLYLLIRRLAAPPPAADGESYRIEVRDGTRTIYVSPLDLDWAQAAGNYVELHGRFGTLLHRRTLAALEQELAAFDFRRIHRSRIVRPAAVKALTTRPSGDFDVELENGEKLAGSRRFRERLRPL